MELWLRLDSGVANGLIAIGVIVGVLVGMWMWARLQGVSLFPTREEPR